MMGWKRREFIIAARRRGSVVATWGASAADGDAGDRIPQHEGVL